MKKVLSFILISTFFVGFLASCGGSGSSDNSDKASSSYTPNLENGKAVYDRSCVACHMQGVAGAAALTDKARWEASAAKGLDTLHAHALNGFQGEHGVMLEKGSCADCSETDVYDAVAYILKEAGVEAK